jgi:uncharacterized protein YndB with AHSA1/START domain
MNQDLIAKATTTIDAPNAKVWDALVNPEVIKQYMFGSTVVSDWQKGSKIIWQGEWQGKPYEDKGVILQIEPGRMIQYSHFSPLSGVPDVPENYHIVTVELSKEKDQTRLSLSQDKNASEQERADSERNWGMMLATLKKLVEQ